MPGVEMALAFPHPIVDRPYEACSAIEKAYFREVIRRLRPYTGPGVNIQISDTAATTGYLYRLKAEWKHGDVTVQRTGLGKTPGDCASQLIGKVQQWSTGT